VLTGGINLLTDYLHSSEAQHCVECDDDTTSGVFFTRAAIPTSHGGQQYPRADARWMASALTALARTEELQRSDSIDFNRNQREES
jgi:hypothetical protein